MCFRELLNWIHEQDLYFYLNRLDKLLTKVGPLDSLSLDLDSTCGLEEAATHMLPPKDEISSLLGMGKKQKRVSRA